MMKKISFYASAAVLAVSALLTSCSAVDYCPYKQQVVVTNVAAEKYSIVASSNEAATFTVNVASSVTEKADKKGATFKNIDPANKTVLVTATLVNSTGFVTGTQTATVKLSSANTSASIAFTFTKKSTDTQSQATVAGSATPVTVSSNQSNINASLTIPGGTTATGGTAEDYSVTAYETNPTVVAEEDVQEGQPIATEDSKIMVLECTPDGASFDQPLTLKVNVGKELTGETMKIKNGNEEVSGVVDSNGDVDFTVTHFSAWNVLFAPIVESKTKGSISLESKTINVVEGNNVFSYQKNVGVEYSCTGLMAIFINTLFGETTTKIATDYVFTCSANGQVNITLQQQYIDYVFKYGNKRFSARVWGAPVGNVEVIPGGDEPTPVDPGHSGGSGN